MTRDQLDRLMHLTLVQLELASTAPVAKMDADRVTQSHDHNTPRPTDAPHLRLRAAYQQASTDEDRRRVVTAALDELRAVRYARRPTIDVKTRDGRMKIGCDKRPVTVLAYVYGYSERHIHRLRQQARDAGLRDAA